MIRVGSWFAGIGGFDLGLETAGGFETVFFVENNPYCQKVLGKHWPAVPQFGDILGLDPATLPPADLWCGGFPCQPFSVAGARKGVDDERHLWPVWFKRFISEVRPRYLLLENVPGLLSLDGGRIFGSILSDLAKAGYDTEWSIVSARDIGAPHRRERLWIWCVLGNSAVRDAQELKRGCGERRQDRRAGHLGWETDPADLANDQGEGPQGDVDQKGLSGRCRWCAASQQRQLEPAPLLGRVAHGIPDRVDRLRCLGNAVVPQVVAWIGERIKEEIE